MGPDSLERAAAAWGGQARCVTNSRLVEPMSDLESAFLIEAILMLVNGSEAFRVSLITAALHIDPSALPISI